MCCQLSCRRDEMRPAEPAADDRHRPAVRQPSRMARPPSPRHQARDEGGPRPGQAAWPPPRDQRRANRARHGDGAGTARTARRWQMPPARAATATSECRGARRPRPRPRGRDPERRDTARDTRYVATRRRRERTRARAWVASAAWRRDLAIPTSVARDAGVPGDRAIRRSTPTGVSSTGAPNCSRRTLRRSTRGGVTRPTSSSTAHATGGGREAGPPTPEPGSGGTWAPVCVRGKARLTCS